MKLGNFRKEQNLLFIFNFYCFVFLKILLCNLIISLPGNMIRFYLNDVLSIISIVSFFLQVNLECIQFTIFKNWYLININTSFDLFTYSYTLNQTYD